MPTRGCKTSILGLSYMETVPPFPDPVPLASNDNVSEPVTEIDDPDRDTAPPLKLLPTAFALSVAAGKVRTPFALILIVPPAPPPVAVGATLIVPKDVMDSAPEVF